MKEEKKVHFIGIGGIGVSALAQYYLEKGHKVTGSDLTFSEITDLLRKKGARIKIGKHNSKNIPKDVNLVIYSPAVEKNNPELKKAYKIQNTGYPPGARLARGGEIQIMSYPEALGELTKQYFTISVSGAHGKSTTTSMIALILIEAGLDPTVVVGTKLKEFNNSNFRMGNSKYLVIEADEWNASFLNYWPQIIVLTNIEREHLDFYKNLDCILKTFKEYVSHLLGDGVVIANKDDENINKVLASASLKIENYSLEQKEKEVLREILKVPGEHNISNALAALTVARVLGISDDVSFKALSSYKGAWRRFDISQKRIAGKNITLVNDYGHHPTEIKATLKAAREKFLYPPKFSKGKIRQASKKIWCVFQPHQYQRTFNLFDDFVFVFRNAPIDKIIITDIYSVAGREKAAIKKKINSQKLVKAINNKNVTYLKKLKIVDFLKENLKNGQVLLLMGAGDIYELNKEL